MTTRITEAEAKILIDALEAANGNQQEAARNLNLPRTTFQHRLYSARRFGYWTSEEQKQTLQGHNPECDLTQIVPSPLVLRGVSTYYNKDGEKAGQWVKSKLDDEKVEEYLRQALSVLSQEVKGLSPLIGKPERCLPAAALVSS